MGYEVTPQGRTYFIRKHVADQLRVYGAYDPTVHNQNEFETVWDICDACHDSEHNTGLWPVVVLLPKDKADNVNMGYFGARLEYRDETMAITLWQKIQKFFDKYVLQVDYWSD